MTNLTALMTTGHRLFRSLLLETSAAVSEAAWEQAQARLAEFAWHMEKYMRAEETVLFPRLRGQSEEIDAALSQALDEHQEILSRMRTAMSAVETRIQVQCEYSLGRLSGALASHCLNEEPNVYPFTAYLSEDAVIAVAHALRSRGVCLPRSFLSSNDRLH